MDQKTYDIATYAVRIANNILSDIAGNYAKFPKPVKEAFVVVLKSLLDLQSALCEAEITDAPPKKIKTLKL